LTLLLTLLLLLLQQHCQSCTPSALACTLLLPWVLLLTA
jgi:hypothetical protein